MKRNRLSFKRDLDCRGTIDRSLIENNSILVVFYVHLWYTISAYICCEWMSTAARHTN